MSVVNSTDGVTGRVAELAAAQLGWQREIYRDLHRNPELSMTEHRTAGVIARELTALGLESQRVGGTGVVAVVRGGAGAGEGSGPVVLARADIDALPVQEETGLEYSSEVPGVMHACGHDAHTAALLGTVRVLTETREEWSGTYIALFQPGEETAEGARAMVEDGLVDVVPRPDVALALHVMPGPAGMIGTVAGPVLSAGDSLRITLYGRGAHGSMPNLAVDPVVLAAAIVLRLQTVVAREVEPGTFAVVTVGAVNAGSKSNIIPDRAELLVNLRSYDPAVRATVIAAVERIVRGECAAAGTRREPDFEYYDRFPLTSNDPDATTRVTEALRAHFGAEALFETSPLTGSEDFSHIPDAFGVPYTYWIVGTSDPAAVAAALESGTFARDIPVNHSPHFAPLEDPTLLTATRSHLAAALAYLRH